MLVIWDAIAPFVTSLQCTYFLDVIFKCHYLLTSVEINVICGFNYSSGLLHFPWSLQGHYMSGFAILVTDNSTVDSFFRRTTTAIWKVRITGSLWEDFNGGLPRKGPVMRKAMLWYHPWWRHQMETFSALLAICPGNSPVSGEFPAQRPVTRSFDVFFDLRMNKRLSKQWRGWWFETLSRPLWRHCNDDFVSVCKVINLQSIHSFYTCCL